MECNGHCEENMTNGETQFRKVTHVLFDLDGVILDSEVIYEVIIAAICNKYGKKYPWDVRMSVLGTTEQRTARTVIKEVGLPITEEEFIFQMNSIGREAFKNVQLIDGAERLIRHLHSHNVPIALGTSSSKEGVAIKVAQYISLLDLLHHKVMGSSDEEVKFGKPHPDIYLVCASRFPDKPKPEDCLVIEDAPNGVTAGNAAGMQTVMIPAAALDRNLTKHATLVIDNLNNFKPELFGLPPFKN